RAAAVALEAPRRDGEAHGRLPVVLAHADLAERAVEAEPARTVRTPTARCRGKHLLVLVLEPTTTPHRTTSASAFARTTERTTSQPRATTTPHARFIRTCSRR